MNFRNRRAMILALGLAVSVAASLGCSQRSDVAAAPSGVVAGVAVAESAPTGSAPPLLTAATPLRSGDLRADIDVLEQVYRSLHPGLSRYNTEAQLATLFADARREAQGDLTLAEAFLLLTRLTAGIKCGHSYPNFFNQGEAVSRALFRSPRLPFCFCWLGDNMIVTRNLSGRPELPAGTLVESIGGLPTNELLRAMFPLARADGANQEKRRSYLEAVGDGDLEAFDILLSLLHPEVFAADGRMELAVRTPDGVRSLVTVHCNR